MTDSSAKPGLTAQNLTDELQKYASDSDAAFLQRFFKTGAGQYGEGDLFIGVRVPATRRVCAEYSGLALTEVEKLISSPIHEHRMAGVVLLANPYARADESARQKIYELYMSQLHRGNINNWDLVDVTCGRVVGAHLLGKDRSVLQELARSENLWERRVAIISTSAFINRGDAATTLELAEILLHDKHDLIHKAVGWMLREVGKRVDEQLLVAFLDEHVATMPRTMLRYAVERLTPETRRRLMLLASSRV